MSRAVPEFVERDESVDFDALRGLSCISSTFFGVSSTVAVGDDRGPPARSPPWASTPKRSPEATTCVVSIHEGNCARCQEWETNALHPAHKATRGPSRIEQKWLEP